MLKTVSTYVNVIGALVYRGTWDAATNNPTLTSSVGNKGDYYYVNVAGSTNLNGITDWQIGDLAIFNGAVWQKVDNTDAVQSVNGQTGAVVLTAANVGATPNTTFVLAGTGISGGGQLTGNVTINLANTAVTAGTYGTASQVSQVTVDAQGRITSAANVAIAIANSAVSGLGTMATQNANNVAITGGNVTATNVTTTNSFIGSAFQASGSAGGTLKSSSGAAQMQWGSGGGNNLSLEVATNINPANAAVSISPTGSGTVSINPAGGGSANLTNITAANVTVTANLFANLTTTSTAAMPDPSLPLAPEGYITVYVNGSAKKIPYYGV
jgi:hypothetical protein